MSGKGGFLSKGALEKGGQCVAVEVGWLVSCCFFLHSPADMSGPCTHLPQENFSHSPSDEGCNSAAIFY